MDLKSLFSFCVILVIFLAYVTANNNGVTIELDGKFTQELGRRTSVLSTSGKFEFNPTTGRRVKRIDRSTPVVFTGRITLRSPVDVVVIGVNASFQHIHIKDDIVESNRVKRSQKGRVPHKRHASPKRKRVFFGQFNLGDVPEALNVKLVLETEKLYNGVQHSVIDNPIMAPRIGFGFKGTFSARNNDLNAVFSFATNFEFTKPYFINEGQRSNENRIKRESEPTTLNLNGDLTTEYSRLDGSKTISVTAGHAVATLELVCFPAQLPQDEFDAADERTAQFIFETYGNVTRKFDDTTVFSAPLDASVRYFIPKRNKRNTEHDVEMSAVLDQKVTEWEYDGIFSSQVRKGRKPDVVGITAKSQFWLISKNRISV